MTDHVLANPELAEIEVEELSRSSFLAKGVLAAGAVYGTTMIGPFLRQAFAQGGAGDVDILNFALTLEYLEAAFYQQATEQLKPTGELGSLVELIGSDENMHVEGLKQAITDLGATPVAAPGVDFGKAFADEKSFLMLAQTFEDTGVSAYNGTGPSLKSKELLGTAGSIVQIEARHAAAIRLMNGETPAPEAFDKTLDMDQVLTAVKPFVKA
ncbi:MAG: ferritin-like domain-containing protein [Solirubrobacterales bacterium]